MLSSKNLDLPFGPSSAIFFASSSVINVVKELEPSTEKYRTIEPDIIKPRISIFEFLSA